MVASDSELDEFEVRDGDAAKENQRFYDHIICFPEIVESMKGAFAHIAIGSNDTRQLLHQKLIDIGVSLKTISHPVANISDHANSGPGCFFAAFSLVGPDCEIGKSTIINHAAVVDHDCQIGDFSHIAPNATLGGNVIVGKNCLIGAGATILPGLSIADNVVVGAGSVVVRDIEHNEPDLGYWIGNPAQNKGKK